MERETRAAPVRKRENWRRERGLVREVSVVCGSLDWGLGSGEVRFSAEELCGAAIVVFGEAKLSFQSDCGHGIDVVGLWG